MPARVEVMLWLFEALKVVWVAAVGACVGSLINVLVYRLPRGLSVVTPPSRCPACNTRLTWRENIPIFGWLLLRGRCRFCKSRISPEYPIVEAVTAALFGATYWLFYEAGPGPHVLGRFGAMLGQIAPAWAGTHYGALASTWPMLVIVLILLGSLVAMTIVDAKTFTIPLVLAWTPTLVAVLIHPLHAAAVSLEWMPRPRLSPAEAWLIPGPMGPGYASAAGWWWVGAAPAAFLGLAVSLLLVRAGLIRRSFADYEAWELAQLESLKHGKLEDADLPAPPASDSPPPSAELPPVPAAAEPLSAVVPSASADPAPARAHPPTPAANHPSAGAPELWIQYPYARREMIRELAFLAPIVIFALLGGFISRQIPLWSGHPYQLSLDLGRRITELQPPLWITALIAALMGYLIGGGIVWAVRILGSLGFGKEAMGLGDVHLMAAVGAALGWIDATLAFFGAAFVGVGWAFLGRVFHGGFARQLPYGPFLAIATVLVVVLKPWIEWGLSRLAGAPVNLP